MADPKDLAQALMGYGSDQQGAAFGIYPNAGKRKNNDRVGSADMPFQAARGWAAGTLGLPGDIETMGRQLIKAGASPGSYVGRNMSETSALPTSDFYKEYLPLGTDSAGGKAAANLGSMFGGLGPTTAAKAVKPIGMGLLGAAEKAGDMGRVALENHMVKSGMIQPATVWHGSPHKFDAFDSSKIGTGEGAQAYGHGLYLAENKGVADEYATKLSKSIVDFTNSPINPVEVSIQQKLQSLADRTQSGNKLDEINKVFDSYLSPSLTTWNPKHPQANSYNGMAPIDGEKLARVVELRDAAKRLGRPDLGDSGSLYKVDLPDEHIAKMLDWDKPLSQQHPDVQGILGMNKFGANLRMPSDKGGWALNYEPETLGKKLYAEINKEFKNPSAATEFFQQQGIPGIRYLDGGSRATGGTSNYVVFPGNESMLNILERNGQATK